MRYKEKKNQTSENIFIYLRKILCFSDFTVRHCFNALQYNRNENLLVCGTVESTYKKKKQQKTQK